MSKESRMAENVKQAVLKANAKDLLLFRTMPAYYRSPPGKLANELVAMDKAGATKSKRWKPSMLMGRPPMGSSDL